MPVSIFGYCYGRIFHVIRRQRKVFAGHSRCGQEIPTATTSHDPQNTEQVQQQAPGTTGSKLSRREMNVLQTMIAVIVCFLLCWSVADIADFLQRTEVSMSNSKFKIYQSHSVGFANILPESISISKVSKYHGFVERINNVSNALK